KEIKAARLTMRVHRTGEACRLCVSLTCLLTAPLGLALTNRDARSRASRHWWSCHASGLRHRADSGHIRAGNRRADVVADRGQTLQNGLPLFPIKLTQERPQTLNESVFKKRFAVGFRNEEAIQADSQRFGNFFERSEAGRLLSALNRGKIGARDARAGL